MDATNLRIIARIKTDFDSKFGVPRQSGLVKNLMGTIVFEPEYRNPDALRGLEGFSHIWLVWQLSEAIVEGWSPTVRPPRLGGNKRMGVFATRSPFRPNPIGLSSVKLEEIKTDPQYGTVLVVSGADLMDGTPIYDIKPYLAFTDSHPDAKGGFADDKFGDKLNVVFPDELRKQIPCDKRDSLIEVLSQDPRPHYQDDPDRIYGMSFAGFDIRFKVDGDTLIVCKIKK
ncbi:MAG: tRNA (N6-threonylcarbamoyladenosine(37)-N6)-methyltransferase TrmO [Eubacteriales bacterium]|nr:tRNA (N6-threonylcarbamoyladenosine(37)-N6)-methyltransferase TrmO [Eubacteriales bacterium]